MYRIEYLNGEEIKGTLYQSEMQKVEVRDDDMWKVEQVLKQHFVKWLNWPKKFNSWISAQVSHNL